VADVGVVGAGIVGLACADALVVRGASVVVYERAFPGAGQSGGESRIFRHAHEDPALVEHAVAARAGWRTWEARLGIELLCADGVVMFGRGGSGIEGVRTSDDVASALPIARERPGVVDEDGGVLRTASAIAALAAPLRVVRDEVLGVERSASRAVVRCTGGRFAHDAVVVCAGRGTRDLAARAGVEIPVRESLHVRLAFRVRGEPPARLACLLDAESGAYGDPLPGNDRYAVGIADDPDEVVDYVARELPGLEPEPVEERHCWVTELPEGHDAFRIWHEGSLVFVAGNNLFKHAPQLGARVALSLRA
jgi:sarcosine oxidase